jgi:hypothetical protein
VCEMSWYRARPSLGLLLIGILAVCCEVRCQGLPRDAASLLSASSAAQSLARALQRAEQWRQEVIEVAQRHVVAIWCSNDALGLILLEGREGSRVGTSSDLKFHPTIKPAQGCCQPVMAGSESRVVVVATGSAGTYCFPSDLCLVLFIITHYGSSHAGKSRFCCPCRSHICTIHRQKSARQVHATLGQPPSVLPGPLQLMTAHCCWPRPLVPSTCETPNRQAASRY